MRKVRRWRYYCEYCKKSGSSGGHMAKHEKGCTMNPDRQCRYCRTSEEEQPKMDDMLNALKVAIVKKKVDEYSEWYTIENEKEAVEKLREVANNCPACMFSAIRQTGYPVPLFESFSFKTEKEAFWNQINADRYEDY